MCAIVVSTVLTLYNDKIEFRTDMLITSQEWMSAECDMRVCHVISLLLSAHVIINRYPHNKLTWFLDVSIFASLFCYYFHSVSRVLPMPTLWNRWGKLIIVAHYHTPRKFEKKTPRFSFSKSVAKKSFFALTNFLFTCSW